MALCPEIQLNDRNILNDRQEKFTDRLQELMEAGMPAKAAAKQAADEAGYVGKNMGYQLLKDPRLKRHVREDASVDALLTLAIAVKTVRALMQPYTEDGAAIPPATRLKAATEFLDRANDGITKEQKITVTHEQSMTDNFRELAAINPELAKTLKEGLGLPDIVDGEYVVVDPTLPVPIEGNRLAAEIGDRRSHHGPGGPDYILQAAPAGLKVDGTPKKPRGPKPKVRLVPGKYSLEEQIKRGNTQPGEKPPQKQVTVPPEANLSRSTKLNYKLIEEAKAAARAGQPCPTLNGASPAAASQRRRMEEAYVEALLNG